MHEAVSTTRRLFLVALGTTAGAVTAVLEALFLAVVLCTAPLALPLAARARSRPTVSALFTSATRPFVALERRRLADLFGVEVTGEPGGPRSLAYLAARAPIGLFGGLVLAFLPAGLYLALSPLEVLDGNDLGIVPIGLVVAYMSVQGTVGLVGTERWLARRFIGPSRQDLLEERVDTLYESRADVVAAVDEERRRIERDLHDGVQQRLVLLGMALGRARRDPGSDQGHRLVEQAYEEAGHALGDLKDVAWRVYPAALADAGLRETLNGLAGRSALPIRVAYGMEHEPSTPVATAAYFVVAEAVTNAVKHSGADRVDVRVGKEDRNGEDVLVVRVSDDGFGGADPSGTGLAGLASRARALDGRLSVHSPVGGPTVVEAELPCG